MANVPPLRPADPAEVADALAYALRYDGKRRVYHADDAMARITAERLIRHLEQAGFVLMRKAPGAAPTTSNIPSSIGVSMDALPYGTDQIIDAAMARALHADACREHALVAWVVMWDPPAYPERFTARLATDAPSPYLLLAETLGAIQAQLPPGLVRSERQPIDPPEVVEIWFAG